MNTTYEDDPEDTTNNKEVKLSNWDDYLLFK